MPTVYEANPAPVPLGEEERKKIREQLNRLLETHHFKNSKRYPTLLRFIVEETLEGRGEFLKERLLGVRVFDRPADYDTAADPIVRVTIAEIRKRIAQYYHDEEHDSEIRIELLPGRYAPEFRLRSVRKDADSERPSAAESAEPLESTASPNTLTLVSPPAIELTRKHPSRIPWYIAAVATLLFLGLALMPLARWIHPTALEVLWAPMLGSRNPILFCMPTDVGKRRGPAGDSTPIAASSARSRMKGSSVVGPTFLDYESLGQNVVYSDMLATLRIANVFAIHNQAYRVRLNVSTTLEDLQQGPTVLIGGLDNQWTMRALAPLRFHFIGSDEDRYWITDNKNPASRDWSLDLKRQYVAVTRDYAIIARLHNDQTGQPEVIVAGIGMSGTAAAGEFIGDERRVEELRQRIGPGFKNHDFEAVLGTDVVNGIAGSAKVVAVAVW
ncbi:MAG: hypothetical protein ABI197_08695 [Granulicella sp.]